MDNMAFYPCGFKSRKSEQVGHTFGPIYPDMTLSVEWKVKYL